ncbi:MAG TPA: carboxypeptidase regulatory-like domain-containing protein [Thermoanaerobaculia bacterium]
MKIFVAVLCALTLACTTTSNRVASYTLDYDTPVDAKLQSQLETLDAELRAKYNMTGEQTAAGVLDLKQLRLAMVNPDRIEYAASVPKVGILLAYFAKHPEAATNLDPVVRHELGMMAKQSSNEMAAKYSRELGLREIQEVLNGYGFYDATHGGGIWVGKHYGPNSERIGDPVADHSHAATVRQLVRYYLMLEQGKLVSPAASKTMREIFESPDLPHDDHKFVKGLAGRDVQIIRKWGSWQDYLHDSAIVTAPNRHYVIVALTHHPQGDDYLADLATAVDNWMGGTPSTIARMNSASITGTVIDSITKAPLANATVTAVSPVGHGSATTDAQGAYTIFNLPPSTYEVTFSATGFKSFSPPTGIRVYEGMPVHLNAELLPLPAQ